MATTTLAPAGPIPADPRLPASSPTQDHVRRLHASGGTYSGIAAAVGLAPTTLRDLASGRRPATPYTTTAVLAVTTAPVPRTPVDAGGTRLRLRALYVMGHGSARIARAAGAHPKTIRALVRGNATTISLPLRDAIIAVYDTWWDKRACPVRAAHRRRYRRSRQPRHHRRSRHRPAAGYLDGRPAPGTGLRSRPGPLCRKPERSTRTSRPSCVNTPAPAPARTSRTPRGS